MIPQFLYARQFLLLTCCGALLGVMSRLPFSGSLAASFAGYGALHAFALTLSLRTHRPFWRQCLFVAIAAILSVMTLRIGILGTHWSGVHPNSAGLYAVLGFSSAIGAVSYGILIRLFGLCPLAPRSLLAISIGCLLASLATLFAAVHFHPLGRWWFAAAWWYAFSCGLWYFDRRQTKPLR